METSAEIPPTDPSSNAATSPEPSGAVDAENVADDTEFVFDEIQKLVSGESSSSSTVAPQSFNDHPDEPTTTAANVLLTPPRETMDTCPQEPMPNDGLQPLQPVVAARPPSSESFPEIAPSDVSPAAAEDPGGEPTIHLPDPQPAASSTVAAADVFEPIENDLKRSKPLGTIKFGFMTAPVSATAAAAVTLATPPVAEDISAPDGSDLALDHSQALQHSGPAATFALTTTTDPSIPMDPTKSHEGATAESGVNNNFQNFCYGEDGYLYFQDKDGSWYYQNEEGNPVAWGETASAAVEDDPSETVYEAQPEISAPPQINPMAAMKGDAPNPMTANDPFGIYSTVDGCYSNENQLYEAHYGACHGTGAPPYMPGYADYSAYYAQGYYQQNQQYYGYYPAATEEDPNGQKKKKKKKLKPSDINLPGDPSAPGDEEEDEDSDDDPEKRKNEKTKHKLKQQLNMFKSQKKPAGETNGDQQMDQSNPKLPIEMPDRSKPLLPVPDLSQPPPPLPFKPPGIINQPSFPMMGAMPPNANASSVSQMSQHTSAVKKASRFDQPPRSETSDGKRGSQERRRTSSERQRQSSSQQRRLSRSPDRRRRSRSGSPPSRGGGRNERRDSGRYDDRGDRRDQRAGDGGYNRRRGGYDNRRDDYSRQDRYRGGRGGGGGYDNRRDDFNQRDNRRGEDRDRRGGRLNERNRDDDSRRTNRMVNDKRDGRRDRDEDRSPHQRRKSETEREGQKQATPSESAKKQPRTSEQASDMELSDAELGGKDEMSDSPSKLEAKSTKELKAEAKTENAQKLAAFFKPVPPPGQYAAYAASYVEQPPMEPVRPILPPPSVATTTYQLNSAPLPEPKMSRSGFKEVSMDGGMSPDKSGVSEDGSEPGEVDSRKSKKQRRNKKEKKVKKAKRSKKHKQEVSPEEEEAENNEFTTPPEVSEAEPEAYMVVTSIEESDVLKEWPRHILKQTNIEPPLIYSCNPVQFDTFQDLYAAVMNGIMEDKDEYDPVAAEEESLSDHPAIPVVSRSDTNSKSGRKDPTPSANAANLEKLRLEALASMEKAKLLMQQVEQFDAAKKLRPDSEDDDEQDDDSPERSPIHQQMNEAYQSDTSLSKKHSKIKRVSSTTGKHKKSTKRKFGTEESEPSESEEGELNASEYSETEQYQSRNKRQRRRTVSKSKNKKKLKKRSKTDSRRRHDDSASNSDDQESESDEMELRRQHKKKKSRSVSKKHKKHKKPTTTTSSKSKSKPSRHPHDEQSSETEEEEDANNGEETYNERCREDRNRNRSRSPPSSNDGRSRRRVVRPTRQAPSIQQQHQSRREESASSTGREKGSRSKGRNEASDSKKHGKHAPPLDVGLNSSQVPEPSPERMEPQEPVAPWQPKTHKLDMFDLTNAATLYRIVDDKSFGVANDRAVLGFAGKKIKSQNSPSTSVGEIVPKKEDVKLERELDIKPNTDVLNMFTKNETPDKIIQLKKDAEEAKRLRILKERTKSKSDREIKQEKIEEEQKEIMRQKERQERSLNLPYTEDRSRYVAEYLDRISTTSDDDTNSGKLNKSDANAAASVSDGRSSSAGRNQAIYSADYEMFESELFDRSHEEAPPSPPKRNKPEKVKKSSNTSTARQPVTEFDPMANLSETLSAISNQLKDNNSLSQREKGLKLLNELEKQAANNNIKQVIHQIKSAFGASAESQQIVKLPAKENLKSVKKLIDRDDSPPPPPPPPPKQLAGRSRR